MRRPPANAGNCARDGSPKGRNREAGSVHDSPARGACPRAGAILLNVTYHSNSIDADRNAYRYFKRKIKTAIP